MIEQPNQGPYNFNHYDDSSSDEGSRVSEHDSAARFARLYDIGHKAIQNNQAHIAELIKRQKRFFSRKK